MFTECSLSVPCSVSCTDWYYCHLMAWRSSAKTQTPTYTFVSGGHWPGRSRGVCLLQTQRPTPKADAAYPVRTNSKHGTQTWNHLLNIRFLTRSPTTKDVKGGLDCKPSTEAKHVLSYRSFTAGAFYNKHVQKLQSRELH